MWQMVVGALLGALLVAGLAGSPVRAQWRVEVPVGLGHYDPVRVGIPMGAQIVDVRWSGDRRGEFTIRGTIPEALRRPGGHR